MNSPPVASSVTVFSAKSSPAVLRFALTDAESDAVTIELTYLDPGGGGRVPATLTDEAFTDETGTPRVSSSARTNLATSPGGMVHHKTWDFATDLGLAQGMAESVQLRLEITAGGGTTAPPAQPAPQLVELGNEAPTSLLLEQPDGTTELNGITPLRLRIEDPTEDSVQVQVEYRFVGGAECTDFHRARDAELEDPLDDGEEFAFDTDADGEQETFFWDTGFARSVPTPGCELAAREERVQLRFTVEEVLPSPDDVPNQVTFERGPFQIDNNAAPVAVLDEGSLFVHGDERGGIPIPFRVFDDESDPVRVLVQWARAGEGFPALPSLDPDELVDLLDDPARAAEREQLQIATEVAATFRGRVGALSTQLAASEVRLPEVATRAAGLSALGIVGRSLEILRRNGVPEVVSWNVDPFTDPVDLVLGVEEDTALVLDADGGGWRVVEVVLATGEVLRTGATNAGTPVALALDPRREVLCVLTSLEVQCLEYPSGIPIDSVAHQLAEPRDLAALSGTAVAVTGDTRLVRVDFRLRSASTLLEGMAEPTGVILDPLNPERLFVAERAADRVISVSLRERVPEPIQARVDPADVPELGLLALPSPRVLAFERGGAQLLVACEEPSGAASLRSVSIRSPHDLDEPPDGRADPFVVEVTGNLGSSDLRLATGADTLRVALLRASGEIALGGGVEQRRVITGYDPRRQLATVAVDFDPALEPGKEWRVEAPVGELDTALAGKESVFVWDSNDMSGGGMVDLQLTPIDRDVGLAARSSTPRRIRSPYDDPPVVARAPDAMGFPWMPDAVVTRDLDGDGDLDLVTMESRRRRIDTLGQRGGVFEPLETVFLADSPSGIVCADFDRDGLQDVAVARSPVSLGTGVVEIFFPSTPGAIAAASSVVVPLPMSFRSLALVGADLDGDLDLDLACALSQTGIALFFQTAPRSFVLGGVLQDPALGSIGGLDAVDLDGDGDLDLATASRVSGLDPPAFLWFEQTAPGAFVVDPAGPVTDPSFVLAGPLVSGDFDGDGDLDVVVSNSPLESLTLVTQTAPGVFEIGENGEITGVGLRGAGQLAALDLNMDELLDIAALSTERDEIVLLAQAAPGRFEAFGDPLQDEDLLRPVGLVADDMDGDGDPDLLTVNTAASSPGPGSMTLFRRRGPGSYSNESSDTIVDIRLQQPRDVDLADLDQDGDVDLVLPVFGNLDPNGELLWFRQSSPGRFDPVPDAFELPPGSRVGSIRATDLDGDGAVDVVAANEIGTVWLQVSPGVFGAPSVIPGIDDMSRVEPADLDGDGDVDLLFHDFSGSDAMSISFQLSPGIFSAAPTQVTHPDLTGPGRVIVVDFDEDGDLDLVAVTLVFESSLVTFEQVAPGVFAHHQTIPVDRAPTDVAAADLDGDGDVDLVSANSASESERLSVFFQTGGVFVEGSGDFSFPDITGISTVETSDLDGDGDQDIVRSTINGELSVYRQVAPGRFVYDPDASVRDPATLFPVVVLAADLDGDGAVDLVAPSRETELLSIFYGEH